MRQFLVTSAVIEVGAGVGLVLVPSQAALLLLGSSLDTPAALVLGRVAGVALASLGVACWHARAASSAAGAVLVAMLVYNVAVAALLLAARFGSGLGGGALVAAVVLHVGMAGWCAACLRTNPLSDIP